MLLAKMIIGPSRPWSDRYLFFPFNYRQRLSTWRVLTASKRIKLLSPVTFRTSLGGRATRSVGRYAKRKGATVYLLKLVDELVC